MSAGTKASMAMLALLVAVGLYTFDAMAQFNGSFEIKRYYLDEENFFDAQSYQWPASWHFAWAEATDGMRASVGSISMVRFYFTHQIKLVKPMGQRFSIRYDQSQQTFYAPQPVYQEVNLRYGENWGLSAIGFPAHEKKLGNLGYSLSLGRKSEKNHIELSRMVQDALYNDKNPEDDFNPEPDHFRQTPVFYRLILQRYEAGSHYARIEAVREEKAELLSFGKDQLMSYEGIQVDFMLDFNLGSKSALGLIHKRDSEKRRHDALSAGTRLDQELDLSWWEVYWRTQWFGTMDIALGLANQSFSNRIEADDSDLDYRFELTTRQAYCKLQHPWHSGLSGLYSLYAGEAAIYKEHSELDQIQDDRVGQIKAAVGVAWFKVKSFILFINTTWDMDMFTQKQWDGGNLQLMFLF